MRRWQDNIAPARRPRLGAMALIVCALALPAVVADLAAPRNLTTLPLAYDGFLNAVRDATPVGARLLVVDVYSDRGQQLFERSRDALYPRKVIIQPVPQWWYHRSRRLALSWNYLIYRMRHHHVRYLVVWARPNGRVRDPSGWSLPVPPAGRLPRRLVLLQRGWGTLLDLRR